MKGKGKGMVKVNIKLNSIDDIKEFNSICEKQTFDISVTRGRLVVDAKSIQGLFVTGIEQKVRCDIVANKSDCEDFLKQINKFIVK